MATRAAIRHGIGAKRNPILGRILLADISNGVVEVCSPKVAKGRAIQLQLRPYPGYLPLRAAIRLNSELVVNGATQPLLAAEVSFGRLNRDVSEQELNLVEFAAGKVA